MQLIVTVLRIGFLTDNSTVTHSRISSVANDFADKSLQCISFLIYKATPPPPLIVLHTLNSSHSFK